MCSIQIHINIPPGVAEFPARSGKHIRVIKLSQDIISNIPAYREESNNVTTNASLELIYKPLIQLSRLHRLIGCSALGLQRSGGQPSKSGEALSGAPNLVATTLRPRSLGHGAPAVTLPGCHCHRCLGSRGSALVTPTGSVHPTHARAQGVNRMAGPSRQGACSGHSQSEGPLSAPRGLWETRQSNHLNLHRPDTASPAPSASTAANQPSRAARAPSPQASSATIAVTSAAATAATPGAEAAIAAAASRPAPATGNGNTVRHHTIHPASAPYHPLIPAVRLLERVMLVSLMLVPSSHQQDDDVDLNLDVDVNEEGGPADEALGHRRLQPPPNDDSALQDIQKFIATKGDVALGS